MAKYQQYEEYKDSRVEWLGELPKHWRLWKLSHFAPIITCGVASTPEYVDEGVVFLSAQNVKHGKIDLSKGHKFISQKSHMELTKNRMPRKNDILLSRVGTVGEACVVDVDFEFSVFVSLTHLRLNNLVCINNFFVYLCSSKYVKSLHKAVTLVGGGVGNLNVNDLREYKLPIPTVKEQELITNFLDHETTQIDTLIDKQQTLIQLLKEKRQAVISHAVTKGLNPDAPMKDSGVEWLGEVPEHWGVGRVGYYGQVLNGSTPSKANLSYWHPKEVAWLSSGEVNQYYIESPTDYISYKALKECSVTLLPVGTLVMGMIGQGKTRGTSAVTKIEATINQNLAAVIPNENLYSNYAHLFFQAAYKELREDARGGNQAALNCEIIRDFKITIPPINEQRTIFIEVNKISDKFDILIAKAEQAIQLMQERRTALISAAVTGKIDVRGWVAPD